MQQNTSVNSLPQDSLPQATLTPEALQTCGHTTLPPTHNAIFSQALADGAAPLRLQAGQQIDLFGQAHAPASRSAPPENEKEQQTTATCGQSGSASSRSANLQSYLASKLPQVMDETGLMGLYALTWKNWAMPLGPQICAQRAQVRRTSGSDCGSLGFWMTPKASDGVFALPRTTGRPMERSTHLTTQTLAVTAWPTPKARDHHREGQGDYSPSLAAAVTQAAWPTPNAANADRQGYTDQAALTRRLASGHQVNLQEIVGVAGWPTANSTVIEAKQTPPIMTGRKATDAQIGLADVAVHLAAWPTPLTNDAEKRGQISQTSNLPGAAQTSGWPTCSARDYKSGSQTLQRDKSEPLSQMVLQAIRPAGAARITADGHLLTGSTAGMANGGQLSPEHSRWLMGYPEIWEQCRQSYSAWQAWQGLMQQALQPQNDTGQVHCVVTAMP